MKVSYECGMMNAEHYHFLRTQIGWSSYTTEEIEAGLKNSLFIITAYFNKNPIGMGRVIGDGKMVFYIQDIIVLEAYRGKGIGKTIMQHVMNYIENNSVNNSIVGLMAATGKEMFYEKFGFIKRPNDRMGCGMNIWVKK
ncbi:MAG: hypothetical protein A2015_12750 [Spirochaetes bacterium GWF1_31_7]|nr:MAG: hypothetical protein A2Y30_10540 [Spirochaetes bacterium GWE1_32_154]OHD49251.1 MAG: hypothetical protein A2Y29_16170 [Spirochaetes bacterium GWE2_31_10]OHD51813.1 MAG: hypothetical protein A2015_12750 [Spirochaetes bacterium GWF1_31_7]OHD78492.1 MAG: hypothetical protein A2355_05710 [Spirochaetes bacterium RIFOXYB1_FULL_32_8]HBD95329.1 GNAT family N-acetyltransferase [Spirochaetia bacterium]